MRISSMTGALSTLTTRFRRTDMLEIREATASYLDRIWPIFQAIASAGDTHAYIRDLPGNARDVAFKRVATS